MKKLTLLLIVSGLVASSASASLIWTRQNTADENTLALYHLNEGSGTAFTDSSANSFNGTLTSDFYGGEGSGSWLNGGSGTYLSGISGAPGDYMNTISISGVDWDQGLTISLWYRVRDEVGSPNANSIFYLNGPGVVPRVYLNTDVFGTGGNGRLNFTDTQGPGTDLNTGNVNYGADHIWRHIAIVYNAGGDASDGGTWTMYLDNTAVGSTVTVTQNLSNVSSFDIRFMSGIFSTNGLSADVDEIFVQNSVVTDFSNGYLVPEPAAIMLLGIGGSMLLAIRRKRRHV